MTATEGPPEPVVIVVRYRAVPGEADRIERLLAEHAAATRAEPGCVQFLALRHVEDPAEFTLLERYIGRDAFDAHVASPHYQRIVAETIRPLLSERTVVFCRSVIAAPG